MDFVLQKNGSWTTRVRADWADVVSAALLTGAGCTPAHEGGRGRLERFPCPGGHGLVRHYLRGGFIRHFIKETYLLQNRAQRELALTATLFADGLPVPEPLGACWQQRGPFFRGAIATRELDAQNLQEYLHADLPAARVQSLLRNCGKLFRRFHDRGLFHADLQIRNVLVADSGLYLIDFDKAELLPLLTPLTRARNLFRFRRSLLKNGFDAGLFGLVCAGYGVDALPEWVGRVYAKETPGNND